MKDSLKLILFFEYFLLPNSYIVLNKAYFTIVITTEIRIIPIIEIIGQ